MKRSSEDFKPVLWTEQRYAAYVSKSIHSVRKDRARGAGPKFYRVAGSIRYHPTDIQDFLERNADRRLRRKPQLLKLSLG